MVNPLRSIDRWAQHSVERASLLIWLVVIVLAVLVILGILAVVWYTAPGHPVR